MRKYSLLWASPALAVCLTAAAISVILLTASITITDAQQSATSQTLAIQNRTLFQNTEDSFRVQVPDDWVIQDVNNTGSKLVEESTQGYGILAQLCPQEQHQGLLNVSARISSSCQGSSEGIIHIIRYPNLDTSSLQVSNNNNNNNTDNMTSDNILLYHLQKLQEVGYRGIQIANSTETTVNITNPQTNQTIAIVPAKLVEMAYSTNLSPNETRTGYFILTATNATAPNLGTTKGYSIFYEGNSTADVAASDSLSLTTALLPPIRQVFDSFQLIAAPVGVAGQTAAQTGQTECDSSYPDDCIPSPPPDLECGDDGVPENFEVHSPDPHGFDGDDDGIGCESESGSNQRNEGQTNDDGDDENTSDDNNGDNGSDDDNNRGEEESEDSRVQGRGASGPADDYDGTADDEQPFSDCDGC